ncbi:hypothetical protein CYMTET_43470, partial [Cymbomonas tetramitiformis]
MRIGTGVYLIVTEVSPVNSSKDDDDLHLTNGLLQPKLENCWRGSKRLQTPELQRIVNMKSPSPNIEALQKRKTGLWTELFFTWMNPLLKKGQEDFLQIGDLWAVDDSVEAKTLSAEFENAWNSVRDALREKSGELHVQPSILPVLWSLHKATVLTTAALKLFVDCTQLAPPILVNLLIIYLEEEEEGNNSNDRSEYYGYYICGIFLAFATSKVLVENMYFRLCLRLGISIRVATTCALFNKSLRLCSAARTRRSTGETVNIMQIDTQSLEQVCMMGHFSWSGLIQVFGFSAQLIYYVGPSGLAGIAVMFFLIPLNRYTMMKSMICRKAAQKDADKRIKTVGEVLNGIPAVKTNAWEEAFSDRVGSIRRAELVELKVLRIMSAVSNTLFQLGPVMVAVATIVFFAGVEGRDVTPATIFTALVIMGALRFPLMMYPMMLNQMMMASVAKRRIDIFLAEEEIVRAPVSASKTREDAPASASAATRQEPLTISLGEVDLEDASDKVTDAVIEVTDGVFTWEGSLEVQQRFDELKAAEEERARKMQARMGGNKPEAKVGSSQPSSPAPSKASPAELSAGKVAKAGSANRTSLVLGEAKPLNLRIKRGELVAVIGPVGSGKSSLLSAILGEMYQKQGSAHVQGSVAYVPQSSWILNNSLQNNILFGAPLEQASYDRVIELAQLTRDVEILPDGHSTEIGEKGVNLSGGQKQRVSIARALYTKADIFVFDDPLSALDVHVGKEVFKKCILEGLHGRTRLLITNQLQYLQQCDRILTLEDGMIVEEGTYEELMAIE